MALYEMSGTVLPKATLKTRKSSMGQARWPIARAMGSAQCTTCRPPVSAMYADASPAVRVRGAAWRKAARVFEGLHVLQVGGDAVDHRAVVRAAREEHLAQRVHHRDAVGSAPAVELVQEVGSRHDEARDAVGGGGDLLRAQYRDRA